MPSESFDHFRGIHAATVCPLQGDGGIDEDTLAAHLSAVSRADGITGLLINGHAGENFMLSRDEKRRMTEIARQACPSHTLLVCGINAEDSLEAQRHVDDAEAAGADAVLVFPPFSWALLQDADMAVRHHRIATSNSALPLFLYQAGVRAGALAYTAEVLERLVQLPNVIGIKEGAPSVHPGARGLERRPRSHSLRVSAVEPAGQAPRDAGHQHVGHQRHDDGRGGEVGEVGVVQCRHPAGEPLHTPGHVQREREDDAERDEELLVAPRRLLARPGVEPELEAGHGLDLFVAVEHGQHLVEQRMARGRLEPVFGMQQRVEADRDGVERRAGRRMDDVHAAVPGEALGDRHDALQPLLVGRGGVGPHVVPDHRGDALGARQAAGRHVGQRGAAQRGLAIVRGGRGGVGGHGVSSIASLPDDGAAGVLHL